jgi:TrmH family RNA methyltransferase
VQITDTEVATLKSTGVRLFAAVAPDSESNLEAARTGTASIPAATADLTGPCALMIGNEGAGIPEDWMQLADAKITIPTPGRIESLNAAVAGSLLLYEAARQRQNPSNLEPRTSNLLL